jgi:hypothetical protein
MKLFHVRLSNFTLYEFPWNLLIFIHFTLEFRISLHNITQKSHDLNISGHVFLRLDFVLTGGYPFHGSNYWCCFWAAVKSLCGDKYFDNLSLDLEVYVTMLVYLLNAIWLTPSGSSTVHIYTQTIHSTTQLIWEVSGPCPNFASYKLAFVLQLRKSTEKNQAG